MSPSDKSGDLREHAAAAAAPPRVRPLARDEPSVPAQQRVRCDERVDLAQSPSSDSVPARSEPPPIVIREPEALSVTYGHGFRELVRRFGNTWKQLALHCLDRRPV
jgi:hypothetical protein